MITSHEMRDVLPREHGIQGLGLNFVVERGDSLKTIHAPNRTAARRPWEACTTTDPRTNQRSLHVQQASLNKMILHPEMCPGGPVERGGREAALQGAGSDQGAPFLGEGRSAPRPVLSSSISIKWQRFGYETAEPQGTVPAR